MKKLSHYSIPAKLNLRQIKGTVRISYGVKTSRFYEKCPENLQIPLRKIFNTEIFLQGHVAIGFIEDGKYFLTYICDIKFHISESSACSYKYTLHWWKFDLWNPLRKVHEVELFATENISNEIHLMVCQEASSNYMVVHGSLINTDSQSNGKMCYISVIPKFEAKTLKHSLHFKYELLPPHPPFITSISLKLPNVIVLNSGDMLFAILLNDNSLFQPQENVTTPSKKQNKICYCLQNNLKEAIDDEITECISYVKQGFTLLNGQETGDSSLPNSPFDCTTTVIPCTITNLKGDMKLKHAFEHRCFRNSDKGQSDRCEYFICQAQFDAENFMNNELHKREDISKRFVSLRDYDMQLVEVCTERKEIIILVNALVVLRNPIRSDTVKINDLDPLQEQRSMKLVLHTVGYLLSWNVFTGTLNVLKNFPLVEGPGNICKSRQFSPSFSQTVQLRKSWFIPNNKVTSVHVLSNHTVFTGRSLQFLFHPEFPVAVVL